jgi:hypothetical protein
MASDQSTDEAQAKSQSGSGPRIVRTETISFLKASGAPKHLIKAAQKALETNPA